MCGFAGMLGGNWRQEDAPAQLTPMARALEHRGPDDEGLWWDEAAQVGLAHRRLSVVELSAAGHQPMASHNGRYVIAYNGEIYNHADLRKALSAALPWRGGADTETLLAGFEAWGIAPTLERCIGMFAFALWDRQTRCLTLARDRLGEKPLYYGWQGRTGARSFLFASELKALKTHPSFEAKVDCDALAMFMQRAYVPAPHSIYRGVHKLEPGCMLTLSLERPEPVLERYWSAEQAVRQGLMDPFAGSPMEAVDALQTRLSEAVRLELMADVPVGAFLSGGVDSSTVVALMQAQSGRSVKTFSIGFHEDEFNEAAHAKAIARHLGTEHHELYVSAHQALAVIPRLPSLYDEPFADSSQIPVFLLSQLARQHVTVSLSGDGGDELFAGYNRYQWTATAWNKLAKLPLPMRQTAARVMELLSPAAWTRLASWSGMSNRWANVGDKLHKGAKAMRSRSIAQLYQNITSAWPEDSGLVVGAMAVPAHGTDPGQSLHGLSGPEYMMAQDLLTYLPDDILTKVDRAAMGASLETRVPLLDHRVVEFAWRLPMQYKLRLENGRQTTKWALRQVLHRYLPAPLFERPKAGFALPLGEWLRGPLRDWAETLLNESRLKREGILNPGPIRGKWAEHLSRRRNWQQELWCVLMYQAWAEANRA